MSYMEHFTVRSSNGKGIFFWLQVVKLLLKSKEVRSILTSGEPQKTDPPLHLASKAGHVEIVRFVHSFVSLSSLPAKLESGRCMCEFVFVDQDVPQSSGSFTHLSQMRVAPQGP